MFKPLLRICQTLSSPNSKILFSLQCLRQEVQTHIVNCVGLFWAISSWLLQGCVFTSSSLCTWTWSHRSFTVDSSHVTPGPTWMISLLLIYCFNDESPNRSHFEVFGVKNSTYQLWVEIVRENGSYHAVTEYGPHNKSLCFLMLSQ
jgi:hypothetical protein